MSNKTDNNYSTILLIIIFLGFSLYFYNAYNDEITEDKVLSLKCEVTKIEPSYTEYSDTDNLKFKVKEFPNKNFELNYLNINLEEGKNILKHLQSNTKIILDIEKEAISKKGFLGIKPKIEVLGIRKLNSESIPIDLYSIKKRASNLAYCYLSLFGIGILIFILIYKAVKNK